MAAGNRRLYDKVLDGRWASEVYQKAKEVIEQVLGNAGGAMTGRAIKQAMQQNYPSLCDDSISDPDPKKKQPYWEHIVDSAIQNLKNLGRIDRTDSGWGLRTGKSVQTGTGQRSVSQKQPPTEKLPMDESTAQPIKQRLLATLLNLTPSSFEKVVGRILEAIGLTEVTVTGKVADGGIDGHATMPVVSIKVIFQAKKYAQGNNVAGEAVRALIGTVVNNRCDRGILITTSSFTAGAKEEAEKPDSRIVLLDGQSLVDLMFEKGIGIVRVPVVRDELDEGFFGGLSTPRA